MELDPIYVQFSPSIEEYGTFLKYRKNMPFNVQATLPHDSSLVFKGAVDLVNNQADTPTSTLLMRAKIHNSDKLLLPGIYVNVTLELTKDEPTLLVPAASVIELQGQKTVYLVNASNQVEATNIKTSGSYKQHYIVTSGLKQGDMIIVDGLQKIHPGQQVTPKIREKQGHKNG